MRQKKASTQKQQQYDQEIMQQQQFSLPPGAENMDPQLLQQLIFQQQ